MPAIAPGLRVSPAEGGGEGDWETETPGGVDEPGGGGREDEGGGVRGGGGEDEPGTAGGVVVLDVCNCMLQSLPTFPMF